VFVKIALLSKVVCEVKRNAELFASVRHIDCPNLLIWNKLCAYALFVLDFCPENLYLAKKKHVRHANIMLSCFIVDCTLNTAPPFSFWT
jgi:hypothetical protein